MTTAVIIIVLVVGLVLGASLALGRMTYEVEDARDTEYLELDGEWVRYRVVGGGPPVVLVHGFLSSSRIWEALVERLAQRFTVYSLDLTGFGESDKPSSGYGVRNGSRLLYSFFTHFGLNNASVIGHDIGGDIAVKLAADHPDMVGRLVLVATPANEDQIDLPTPLWLATLPVVGALFYSLGKYVRPVRELWLRPFVLDKDDLPEELVEDAGESTPAAVRQSLSISVREISRGRLVRQGRMIKAPVLVIAGEEDQIVDPQATGDWARGLNAEAALMEGVGHLPMVENPAEFNAQIMAFLTGDSRYLEAIPASASRTLKEELPADEEEEEPVEQEAEEEPHREPERLHYPPAERPVEEEEEELEESEAEPHQRDEEQQPEEKPQEPPRRRRRRREEGAPGGFVPELPEDLFEWPSAWEEYRSDRSGDKREHRGEKDEASSDEEADEQDRRD